MLGRCTAALIIALMLLTPTSMAAPLYPAGTTIVGRTGNGEYIHAYEAGNGQILYFTSAEESPSVALEDVNFDDIADIVICTARGETNTYSLFFVDCEGTYVLAEHPGLDEPLCNYTLEPETGHVISHTNHGMAGLLHETYIFTWEGSNLRLLRRAYSEIYSDTQFLDASYASTYYQNLIRFTVTYYTPDRFEGFLVWDHVMDHTADDLEAVLVKENDYLWHNLK